MAPSCGIASTAGAAASALNCRKPCAACTERREFVHVARLLGCVLLCGGHGDALLLESDDIDGEPLCVCSRAPPLPPESLASKLHRRWKLLLALAALVLTASLLSALLPSYSELLRLSWELILEERKALAPHPHAHRPSVAFSPGASVSFPPLELHSDAETERVMDIYCRGPILHAVQMAGVFADSKHFVDMPIKANSSAFAILVDFERRRLALTDFRPESRRRAPHEQQLRRFLDDHFDPPGSELRPITPCDYQESTLPPRIARIEDEELRDWAFALHQLWRTLGRVPNARVRSSYLHSKPLADPALHRGGAQTVLIVPGGRFRESYYWDSYWIVEGLLVSGMRHTARGVVTHLLEYVAEFGFVPNGGRVYYLTRSQPPMLSDMVRLVAASANGSDSDSVDLAYLNATVPILEKEYAFWMQLGPGGHAVEFVRPARDGSGRNVTHLLNRYSSNANHPRPESYREDVDVATELFGDCHARGACRPKKDAYYNDVIAAAESGWDFSSRWFSDHADMKTVATSSVIPVDLNAIMYRMEKNLEAFHARLGRPKRAQFFRDAARQRLAAIDAILWSDARGTWKDLNLETLAHSPVASVSDYTPLWARAFDPRDTVRLQRVVASLQTSGLLQVGGVQATDTYTGQQWDAPNAWPPEQDIVIEGLLAVGTIEARNMARELLQSWVGTSLAAWKHTGLMFEKYNATEVGGLGVGGEYFPQFGFGWTNGVILKFLALHQSLLRGY
ncbi:hypothetical protein PybrP1_001901 [[Pythium] brassicae (nom. inval.)]|nr:hypothetical protein PybrP1_001901 [[Pythium] brassicae (nom. inval.)]